jgi:hypothetical protein
MNAGDSEGNRGKERADGGEVARVRGGDGCGAKGIKGGNVEINL